MDDSKVMSADLVPATAVEEASAESRDFDEAAFFHPPPLAPQETLDLVAALEAERLQQAAPERYRQWPDSALAQRYRKSWPRAKYVYVSRVYQYVVTHYNRTATDLFVSACEEGFLELAQHLMNTRGAVIGEEEQPSSQRPRGRALLRACLGGAPHVVRWLLLDCGVDSTILPPSCNGGAFYQTCSGQELPSRPYRVERWIRNREEIARLLLSQKSQAQHIVRRTNTYMLHCCFRHEAAVAPNNVASSTRMMRMIIELTPRDWLLSQHDWRDGIAARIRAGHIQAVKLLAQYYGLPLDDPRLVHQTVFDISKPSLYGIRENVESVLQRIRSAQDKVAARQSSSELTKCMEELQQLYTERYQVPKRQCRRRLVVQESTNMPSVLALLVEAYEGLPQDMAWSYIEQQEATARQARANSVRRQRQRARRYAKAGRYAKVSGTAVEARDRNVPAPASAPVPVSVCGLSSFVAWMEQNPLVTMHERRLQSFRFFCSRASTSEPGADTEVGLGAGATDTATRAPLVRLDIVTFFTADARTALRIVDDPWLFGVVMREWVAYVRSRYSHRYSHSQAASELSSEAPPDALLQGRQEEEEKEDEWDSILCAMRRAVQASADRAIAVGNTDFLDVLLAWTGIDVADAEAGSRVGSGGATGVDTQVRPTRIESPFSSTVSSPLHQCPEVCVLRPTIAVDATTAAAASGTTSVSMLCRLLRLQGMSALTPSAYAQLVGVADEDVVRWCVRLPPYEGGGGECIVPDVRALASADALTAAGKARNTACWRLGQYFAHEAYGAYDPTGDSFTPEKQTVLEDQVLLRHRVVEVLEAATGTPCTVMPCSPSGSVSGSSRDGRGGGDWVWDGFRCALEHGQIRVPEHILRAQASSSFSSVATAVSTAAVSVAQVITNTAQALGDALGVNTNTNTGKK